MSEVTYFKLANSMVIRVDGKTYTLHKSDHRYPQIESAIEAKQFDNVFDLIDPTKVLNQAGLEVRSGVVYFKNEPIPTILGDQFLEFKIDKVSFMALLNFWMNLKNRTDFDHSREHIITLLQQKGYPVTDDGFIIAYKEQKDGVEVKFDPRMKIVTPFFNYGKTSPSVQTMFDQKKTLSQMLEEVFGFCSKKLVKLATERVFPTGKPYVDDNFFNYGYAFKGVLSPDNLFAVIEKSLYPAHLSTTGSHIAMNQFWHEFAKTKEGKISEKRILNLISSKYHPHNLIACGDAWNTLKLEQAKNPNLNISLENADFTASVDQIQKYLEREIKKLKNPEYDLNIKTTFPKLEQLEKANAGELGFVLPKTNYDLIDWSKALSNCIHGYGQRVKNGETMVVAVVDKSGKMVYNLEIVNGRVVQFRSKGNGQPTEADFNLVMDTLYQNDIIHDLKCSDVRF
jgi:ribosome-associated translation inhibitor RaiA